LVDERILRLRIVWSLVRFEYYWPWRFDRYASLTLQWLVFEVVEAFTDFSGLDFVSGISLKIKKRFLDRALIDELRFLP